MVFVLDASVALSWVFLDEAEPRADLALQRLREDDAIVPALWWFEIGNALVVNERRGRLKEADSAAFMSRLQNLPILVDPVHDMYRIVPLARQHKLTVYDATYLELAQRLGAALATLDAALIKAARAERILLD